MEDKSIAGLGKNKLSNICIEFNDLIAKAGYEPGIYANRNWFDNYLNKDFGNWPWEGNTTLKQWKSAVCDNKDSLLTWAKARTGSDGEFMKQVTELRDVLNI